MLSFKLTIGKVAIAGRDLYTNEAIAALVPKNHLFIQGKFLYYGLHFWNLLQDVDQAIKGVTLNKKKLHAIKIICPENTLEQSKIAEILSTVNEAIRKT